MTVHVFVWRYDSDPPEKERLSVFAAKSLESASKEFKAFEYSDDGDVLWLKRVDVIHAEHVFVDDTLGEIRTMCLR